MCFIVCPLLLSHPWAIVRTIWLPYHSSDQIFISLIRFPPESSLGLIVPAVSAFPPVPSFLPFSGLAVVSLYFSVKPRAGCSCPDMASPVLAERKDHLPLPVPNADDCVIQSWEKPLQMTATSSCGWVPSCWTCLLELLVFGKGNHETSCLDHCGTTCLWLSLLHGTDNP